MSNKFTESQYKERIRLLHPGWQFEILKFDGYKNKAVVQCQYCSQDKLLAKAADIFRKVNPCDCFKRFRDYHEKIDWLGSTFGFEILEDGPATQKKKIRCSKCGKIMYRSLVSILNTPWHCDDCDNYAKGRLVFSHEEAQERLNKLVNCEYELLQFSGMTKSALLKHKNCGKVFKIRELSDLLNGRNRGCPDCYSFKSKGEQKIAQWLDSQQINYIPQKTFAPLNKSKYRFDFFLPSFNLAIEYQGEQHYRDNGFFKDGLTITQQRDKVKREYCSKENIELLEIKYTELSNIDIILSSKLNDYLEREQGEVSRNGIEKDIV